MELLVLFTGWREDFCFSEGGKTSLLPPPLPVSG